MNAITLETLKDIINEIDTNSKSAIKSIEDYYSKRIDALESENSDLRQKLVTCQNDLEAYRDKTYDLGDYIEKLQRQHEYEILKNRSQIVNAENERDLLADKLREIMNTKTLGELFHLIDIEKAKTLVIGGKTNVG